MKLSVIIPIYNVENYLERCLESIVNQDMSDVEIILVNDGSTDNSKKICQVYEKKFSNIKLLNKKNSGTGESRNLGLEIAEGEYIYFCDPDDYIETDLFNNISKMINSNQDVYMFGYWNEIEYDGRIVSSTESCVFKNKSYTRVDFLESFSELFCTNMLYTLWNKVYKKTFLKNNNIIFSNSPMGQDTRFNINVYRYINSFEVIRKSYYHYTILR
ncbi:glycosyltransferase family 2 protein, partial [Candidatus Enterococcus willemsii]